MRSFVSAAAVIALPITAMASTLNDWSPRIANLSSGCKVVYTSDISGCSEKDFGKTASCSAACLKGLQEVATKVKAACADEDFGSDPEAGNILLYFLAGNGPRSVCPNNNIAQASVSSSASTTSTQSDTSTATSTGPDASTTSTAGSNSTETLTSTSSASPTTTTFVLDGTSTISSATSTPIDSQNSKSGGGSPFDDVPSDGAAWTIPCAMTILAALFVGAGLQ
ncbi:uncharacterized protein RCC_09352 [Ramularia collo-cygni]|uniref:Extracellular membrane protein CFEM domain-containing protein n=1 Tax=Ramularia collo-cygni TaxID=112498 RepID=A0A2D3VP49_9PEZI|nr:uncharacterized protein RCC_09352 [Ramularia collo-cygni]CZT23638.1 uncharacterized protein RCC_09352 [Ramularia collo-cygni]